MGVRGTEFSVTAPSTGDILVTCASGDVVVTDEQGRELHALPGTAIEKLEGADFKALPVAGADLESFRKDWEEKRIAFLKTRALEIMQRDVLRYEDLREEFKENQAALDDKRDILVRWEAEEKSGKLGGDTAALEADKREIVDLIGDLRETQFLLERLHYRLAMLKEFHDQGLGEGTIRDGLTTKDFFASYTRDRVELVQRGLPLGEVPGQRIPHCQLVLALAQQEPQLGIKNHVLRGHRGRLWKHGGVGAAEVIDRQVGLEAHRGAQELECVRRPSRAARARPGHSPGNAGPHPRQS